MAYQSEPNPRNVSVFTGSFSLKSFHPLSCPQTPYFPSSKLKTKDHRKNNPSENRKNPCNAMLVTNLDDLTWIQVPCHEEIADVVFCLKELQTENISLQNDENVFSQKQCIIVNGTCFIFEWKTWNTLNFRNTKKFTWDVTTLQFLFDAIHMNFPPIFTTDFQHLLTYETISNTMAFSLHDITTSSEGLHVIMIENKQQHDVGNNVFRCKSGSYISYYFVCDGTGDCLNDNDEEIGCECNHSQTYSSKCKYVYFGDEQNNRMCSHFYYTSTKQTCEMFSDVESSQTRDSSPGSESGEALPGLTEKTDFCVACERHADAKIPVKFRQEGKEQKCSIPGQLQCNKWNSNCYNISEICTFKLDVTAKLFPCENGEHLQTCRKFECNMMFKCPGYYCIPWKYVSDGKWDCPSGSDENSLFSLTKTCSNMFICRKSQRDQMICVHMNDVCDTHVDCPLGDDEFFCTLKDTTCLAECDCLTFVISCHDIHQKDTFALSLLPYRVINLKRCDVFFMENLVHSLLDNVHKVSVKETNLTEICHFLPSLRKMFLVNFEQNAIQAIQAHCFANAPKLKTIQLNNNRIMWIEKAAFTNLSEVFYINITSNLLSVLLTDVITSCPSLTIVDIKNNSLTHMSEIKFTEVSLKFLVTDNFSLCCVSPPEIQCLAHSQWHESCADLLHSTAIKVVCYIISVLIALLNILCTWFQETSAHGTYVIFVGVASLTYAAYLSILWIADIIFSHTFPKWTIAWTSSSPCFIGFALCMFYNFFIPLCLCMMSVARLMVVAHPMSTKFKKQKFVLRCLLWVFFLVFGFVLCMSLLTWAFYSNIPLGVCSPFVDPTHNVILIKLSVSFAVAVQMSAAIVNFNVYIQLVVAILQSRSKIQEAVSTHRSNIPLLVQVIVLTVFEIAHCIPSCVIYIFCLSNEFSIQMVVWATILISTIYSCTTASVFLTTAVRKNLKEKKGNKR